jgi:hypothetical protein
MLHINRRLHHRNPFDFSFSGALVLEWKLESNLLDTSGNGYDGTAPNGVSYVTGQVGLAADLEYSTPQYITSSLSPLTPPYAVSFWAVMHRNTATEFLIDWGDFVVFMDINGKFRATNKSTLNVDNKYFLPAILTWYHVVVNVNSATGGDVDLYIDNVEKTDVVVGNPKGAATTFRVGTKDGGGYPFDGKVDQLRVYNRALTTAEIAALYEES